MVPRRIVPVAQKYSQIRVSSSDVRMSSSEAVTPAHATTKAVSRSRTIGSPRRPGHRLAAMRELGADSLMLRARPCRRVETGARIIW